MTESIEPVYIHEEMTPIEKLITAVVVLALLYLLYQGIKWIASTPTATSILPSSSETIASTVKGSTSTMAAEEIASLLNY